MVRALLRGDARECFLGSVRLFFGGWLLFVGLSKVLGGPAGFVGYIESEFAATWLPGALVALLAWVILVAEPLVGGWLLVGKRQRLAWLCAAALMFLLMIGKTILRDFATVANNWQYLVLCLAAAAWTRADE
ncbi:MAG: hypothetical protein RL417_403 [Pseudomonadota bacterium]|jgi:hypothetical protein